jgi:hypothetical protein
MNPRDRRLGPERRGWRLHDVRVSIDNAVDREFVELDGELK